MDGLYEPSPWMRSMFNPFLSAAQPTDQGEESVVLVVVVVGRGGGPFFSLPCTVSFLGCEKAKNFV